MRLQTARTVLGESVRINAVGGTVRINDSTVTNADVATSNGVIHVIDTVLLPLPSSPGCPVPGAAGVAAPVALAVAGLAVAGLGLRARLKGRADDSAPVR